MELTHALGPKTNELGLIRSPRSREHGIQCINHSLDDTESGDAGSHEGQRSRCEGNSGDVPDSDYRSYGHAIFEDVRSARHLEESKKKD